MGKSLSCPTILDNFNRINLLEHRDNLLDELDIIDDVTHDVPPVTTLAQYAKKKQSLSQSQFQLMNSIVDEYISENFVGRQMEAKKLHFKDVSADNPSPIISHIFDKSSQFHSQQTPLSPMLNDTFSTTRFKQYLQQTNQTNSIFTQNSQQLPKSYQSTAISPRRKLKQISPKIPTFSSH